MDHEVGPWKMAFVNGPTSMIRLRKKLVLRAMGPLLGLNQMWTKRKDLGAKNESADFFNMRTKKVVQKKNQLWPFSWLQ